MTVTIRTAVPAEYDEVGALTAAAFVEDGLTGPDYAAVLADAAARAAVADLMVAVDDDRIVGTVTLVPPDAPAQWREATWPDAGTVRMLAVPRQARGHGIGRLLMDECVARSQAAGWRSLTLLTTEQMLAAQRIYQQMGFVRTPDLDRTPVPGVDLIGFVLPL